MIIKELGFGTLYELVYIAHVPRIAGDGRVLRYIIRVWSPFLPLSIL